MAEAGAKRGWFWVGLGGVALLVLVFGVQKIWAGDTWGQLTSGRWILEHRAWPRADDWSFTARGREVREVRWLYCVLMELGWRVGVWLPILGSAAVLLGLWGVVAGSAWRAVRTPAGLFILGLAVVAGSGRWVLRPELVTYFFVAVFLVLLEGMVRRGRLGWRDGALPGVQVLWVNMHSVYVMGVILAWVVAGVGALEQARRHAGTEARREEKTGKGGEGGEGSARAGIRRTVGPVVVAVLVTAACWVNPYFHRGAIYAAEMWRQSGAGNIVARTLGELQSPLSMPLSRWTLDLWAAAVLGVVVAGTFVWNRRRFSLVRFVVFAMGLYLASKAQRHAAFLAVMGGWAALRNVEEAIRHGPLAEPRRAVAPPWLNGPAMAAVGLLWAGVAWDVATDRWWIRMGAPRETGVGVVEWGKPEGAAVFLKESGAPGQIFNTMRDGGYLVWRSRGKIAVFVDGRTDVYPDAFLEEYTGINAGNWEAVTGKWGINTAILPNAGYEDVVGRLMGAGSGWAAVYLDHRSVVFVREGAAEVVAKYRIDPAAAWTPRGPEPEEGPEGWKRAIGGRGRPWHSLGMADSFMAIGSYANAAAYLRRGLERWPRHPRMAAMLAALEARDGRAREAQELFARLAGDREWEAYSDRLLARLLMESGRLAEAVKPLERAVRAAPGDESMRLPLADLYFRTGDFKGAVEQYRWVLGRGLGGAGEWLKLGSACERTGDAAGAIEAYRMSLKLEPRQAAVENLLGMALGRRGDLAGAAAAFERALAIEPGHRGAAENLEAVRRRGR